jgi:hypothetical protein
MTGLSSAAKKAISAAVDQLFDRMAAKLVGATPRLRGKKTLTIGTTDSNTLAHLFVSALGNREPLPKEAGVLKAIIETAESYIDALRTQTKARVLSGLDAYVAERRSKKIPISDTDVKTRLLDELRRAGNGFHKIAEAESSKARNMGRAATISRVAAAAGVGDPSVYFQIVRDGEVCSECLRLHTTDGVTPRVWKLSEIGFDYHKKGGQAPKFAGLHPHCRCHMVYLSPGFGFKNGNISYLGPDHDEHARQRNQS